MNIIPSEIEKYSRKIGSELYIELDPLDEGVVFRCVRGSYEMGGSTAIFITGKEIMDILHLNKILGDEGEVKKVLNKPDHDTEKKIHDLIYELLVKYLTQMLDASIGKDFFPEIKALDHHHKTYFRRS